MTYARRTDRNHTAVKRALAACGCSVIDLAGVGKGCADLLVGRCGETYLLEVKDGRKPPSARKLTVAQHLLHLRWRGARIHVVTSPDEALKAVGVNEKGQP